MACFCIWKFGESWLNLCHDSEIMSKYFTFCLCFCAVVGIFCLGAINLCYNWGMNGGPRWRYLIRGWAFEGGPFLV